MMINDTIWPHREAVTILICYSKLQSSCNFHSSSTTRLHSRLLPTFSSHCSIFLLTWRLEIAWFNILLKHWEQMSNLCLQELPQIQLWVWCVWATKQSAQHDDWIELKKRNNNQAFLWNVSCQESMEAKTMDGTILCYCWVFYVNKWYRYLVSFSVLNF